MNRVVLLLAITLLNGSGVCAQGNARMPFQPLDLFDLNWVADPRISPDGKMIVYVRAGFDIMKDLPRTSLWITGSDGSGHEPLTSPSSHATSPRWSPDGTRIAYVSNVDGSVQIHVRWLESGRDVAITNLQEAPSSLTWAPDGRRLAFVQFVAKEAAPIGTLPKRPEGAEWSADAKVYEDSYYRTDSSGFLKAGKSHIFIVGAEGGKPIQLTDADYPHDGTLAWSADASRIYFASNYRDNWQLDGTESEIYAIDVATREVSQITDRDGEDYSPAVSPDGRRLAYLGSDDTSGYQDTKLYLADIGTGETRQLLDLGFPVWDAKWSADGRSVYFLYVEESVVKVGRVDLDGEHEQLAANLGGTSIGRPYASGSFSVARNGVLAHDIAAGDQPANLAVTSRGRTRVLTDLNADLVRYRSISEPEEIRYESSRDNVPIQGWIVKPPGFDPNGKYPLILEIHGGPHSAYGSTFSAEIQLYAAAGYVVLYTNPRGSTSYGEAFAGVIDRNYPGPDYDDLMSGVDAMIARGYIDPGNLFVTGGSGGGILTAWIVTRTDRFRAAVSQKPVINWFTHTLTADIGPFFWRFWFADPPWRNPESYLARSPILHVDNVKTPTMLLTGEQDWRTPMSESEQFYQGLKMNGVDAALVRIQDASHSITARPSNLLRKVAYVLGWFERYRVREEERPAAGQD